MVTKPVGASVLACLNSFSVNIDICGSSKLGCSRRGNRTSPLINESMRNRSHGRCCPLGRPETEQQPLARRLAADWHDGQYSASPEPQISGLTPAVPFRQEGRSRVVTNAGWDVVDAAASGAQRGCRAGWRKACERSNGELTNDVAADGEVVWS
jgi:hypothetical protein